MGKRLMGAFAVLMALLVLVPSSVLAQGTTGTIRGKVTDKSNGDPLAAVNVLLLELDGTATTMGAMTNAQGEYVVINVPPGRYNIKATMMGFKDTIVQDKLITVGVSTIQNFTLEQTVLDIGETVTVVGDRDMIQRDVTGTQQSYTIEEMERMAVSSTTDILTLQTNTYQMEGYNNMIPGYRDRGLEQVHMRGGRNAEVAFMIDGMQVTNLVFGGQAASVSPFSLSEMVVMAGGMSAEFGNAMSGVVNMVTREGGSSYDANVEIQGSEFSGQPQDDVKDETNLQGYFGGPVPMVNRLTFFMSGSGSTGRDYTIKRDNKTYDVDPSSPEPGITYSTTDEYTQYGTDGRRLHPLDVYGGWLGFGYDNRWDGMTNVTYKLNPSMKVNFSGQLNGRWSAPYTDSWRYSMLWGAPTSLYDHLTMGTLKYDAVDANDYIAGNVSGQNEKNHLFENNGRAAFVWTHQLNQSTFYSMRGSYYKYDRTMRVKRWINADGYYDDRGLYDAVTDTGEWTPSDPMHKVTLLPIPYQVTNPQARALGYTTIRGVGLGYHNSDRYFTDHRDETRTLKGDVTSQMTTHHQVKAGLLYNALTLDQYDVQLLYLDPPYITQYRRSPWELGLYLQDKVEYDFIILNLGLRYDAANAGDVPFWVDPRNPIDPVSGDLVVAPGDPAQAPVTTGQLRSQISPRLGISHPVTDASVVYFNYGHFFQNPIYRNLYIQGTLEDSVPLIGNPNLESEKTVSYEFGYKHQFTELYALELTMWAKDTSNMVGSERIPSFFQGMGNPYSYTVFLNYDYASSKGVDLSLQKRYSDFWRASFNYSFMTTQSNRDDPWSGYRDRDDLETSPKRPRVLGWDQPHRFTANLSVSIPEGVGPEIGGVRPFQKVNASIIYRANAGRPYTPTTKEKTLERNSGRRPWTFQWDLRLYRDFQNFGLRYSIFADVRNLFNRKNVISVFSRTGKADDPGPSATSYSDNYDRFHYYSAPRSINLGLRLYF